MDKDPNEQSMPELVRSITTDVTELVKKEVELARIEIVEAVNARLKAAGAIAFAAVLGLFVLAFLGLAAANALDRVIEPWAARLVVAGGFLVVAVVAVVFALRLVKSPVAPETKRTLREDAEWAKAQTKQ